MSNRNLVLSVLAASSLGVAAMPGLARAADLDPPFLGSQQDPPDRVEFGTGWYIRGDLGATRLPKVVPTPSTLLNNSQASQYFNAGGNPQQVNDEASSLPPSIFQGSQLGYNASIGAGYQFTSWLRADLIGDFHKPVESSVSSGNYDLFCQTGIVTPQVLNSNGVAQPVTGDCQGTYGAKLSSYDVLANLYIDIGTWYHVTPYVGVGAGLGFGHYQTSSTYVQGNNSPYNVSYTSQSGGTTSENFNRTSSGTYYNFAYALMAGAAIDVFDHTKLDLGYRYLNLGSISGISGKLYSNELRAGVRYMIDN